MKKLREEIEFKSVGGLNDIFDDYVKGLYNITDDEYDYLAEKMSDGEMDIFVSVFGDNHISFTIKRKALEIRNKYLKQYNDERND
jgi:hypothetical protein